jgi:hypothetical protein
MTRINIRINNIQFQHNGSTQGEFKLWYPNIHHGKLQERLKDGWEDKGEYIVDETGSYCLHKNMFNLQEHCYVIAYLKYDKRDEVCDLITVGNRLLGIKNIEDFMEVYKIADKKMMELATEEKECPVCTADEKCWECADDVSTESAK